MLAQTILTALACATTAVAAASSGVCDPALLTRMLCLTLVARPVSCFSGCNDALAVLIGAVDADVTRLG